ncbi:MAG: thioredoxin-disulfide reductase [Candidatus Aenigmatarchaeota archaeon]
MYDLIIVGGGPAGLTAGIYAGRRNLKTLIITKNIGGQASLAFKIENYPGFLEISGYDLIQKFYEQAINSGVEIFLEEVVQIEERNKKFLIKTNSGEYEAKAVILASGKSQRTLNVPGEKEFLGRGVSYCAVCDLPLFKDKEIAVIGGGNSALDTAIYGSEIAKKVYLIHRRDSFRGFENLVEKVKEKDNVEIVLNTIVKEIKGQNFVNSIVVENVVTKEYREISVDGVFIEIGYETKTDFLKNLVMLDDKKQVITNKNCETFYPDKDEVRPGVFAAGDLTDTLFKQVVISAGEGAKAALQAYNYIHGI